MRAASMINIATTGLLKFQVYRLTRLKSDFEAGMKHNKFFRVMFCYVLCQIFYSSVMLCSVM